MTSDVALAEAIEEYEESVKQQMANEAATMVVVGRRSRDDAVKAVTDLYRLREDASEGEILRDNEGNVDDYLVDEMRSNPPRQLTEQQKKQIYRVAEELKDHFD